MHIVRTAATVMSAAALAATTLWSAPAAAEYPEKPIKVFVGFSAGGGTDTYARTMASLIHEEIDMPMIIVNKPGGSGSIAANLVSKQKPDGYTLFFHSSGSFLIKSLRGESDVNAFDHFEVVSQIGVLTPSIVVPAGSPFTNPKELVAAAKADPGKLRWAHTGAGSVMHTAGAAFLIRNGIKATGVPFKGGSKARAALVADKVQFGVLGVQQLKGFENSIRPLGVSSDKRDAVNKNIPTLKESGVEALNVTSPMVLYAPKGTPKAIVEKLDKAVSAVTKSKGFKRLIKKSGLAIVYQDGGTTLADLKDLNEGFKPIVAETKRK